ncbi:hypothetical protein PENTCL1PPCAC_8794, partial [Pristionchus entomophagus]
PLNEQSNSPPSNFKSAVSRVPSIIVLNSKGFTLSKYSRVPLSSRMHMSGLVNFSNSLNLRDPFFDSRAPTLY